MTEPQTTGGLVPEWNVGDRMRKARACAGMTTDEMAADIGRTRRTISNYESASTPAPLLVLRQYALRTGVPLVWLQHGDDGPEGGTPITRPVTDEYPGFLHRVPVENVLRAA